MIYSEGLMFSMIHAVIIKLRIFEFVTRQLLIKGAIGVDGFRSREKRTFEVMHACHC